MVLTPQWLDELRARTALSALIGRSIKVTKAGREYKACCPFHNEKTPSFTINDEKGFYHCLAGETQVITSNGRFPIRSLAGTTASVLSRNGKWVPSPFHSYGKQRLWEISLSRNGVSKTIHATSHHRWFVHDRAREYTTMELKTGHALCAALPDRRESWELDPAGVRHGIVFGDGSMYKGVYGTLNLHGEKDVQLKRWFPEQDHHIHERTGGNLYLRVYGGRSFEGMKRLPSLHSSDSYLLGFLAGYVAADGHVAKDGTVMLNSADAETLEAVRDICTKLGIGTFGRTTLMRNGYGDTPSALHRIHFVNSTLVPEFFLLNGAMERFMQSKRKFERLRWVVKAVRETDRVEEVYCAQVPSEHAFALDDNILTGNCFGCGAHGDAIRWMTDQRGLGFMDAVKELADAAGMPVPAPDPMAAKQAAKQAGLHDVMAAAQEWFVQQFQGLGGAAARTYLERRGIGQQAIRDFGIGFAPDSRSGLKDALKPFGDDLLIEGGLLIKMDDKEPYDRFRGRLMIPIRDARGRVIAFGGRILGDGEPKYLNSPDTPLFDKGRTLYNLDTCSPAARHTGRVIVVEGYMDVIALAQAGFPDVVAPLGTALTEWQIQMLWRMTEKPVVCFDGDAAGQKAAMRAAQRALPLLKPGHSLQFVSLPSGQDPDDLVKSGGAAAFQRLIEISETLVDRLWNAERHAQPLVTPEDRASLKQRLGQHVAHIADGDIHHHYAAAFRERLGTLFAPNPRKTFVKTSERQNARWQQASSNPASEEAKGISSKGSDLLMQGLLVHLLRHPIIIEAHREALTALQPRHADQRDLLSEILDQTLSKKMLDSEGLLTILGGHLYNVAQRLLAGNAKAFRRKTKDGETDDITALSQYTGEMIKLLKQRPALEQALERATIQVSQELTEENYAEQQRLRSEKEAFDRRIFELTERNSNI